MTDTPDTQPQDEAQPEEQQTPCGVPEHGGYCDYPRAPGCAMCAYHERAAHEAHRHQLAAALGGLDEATPWDGLIRRAGQILAGRHRAVDKAAEIEADRNRLAAELRDAEAVLASVREIGRRLVAHAAGFQDVLDETDHSPWGRTVGADITALLGALGDPQPGDDGADDTDPASLYQQIRAAANAELPVGYDDSERAVRDFARDLERWIPEAEAPRLLDCGLCYEENGEEVHPHPECTATSSEPKPVACEQPAIPDLAAFTAPVGPRNPDEALLGNHPPHPVHALFNAITGYHVDADRAEQLIKAYYDAITSAPPAETELLLSAAEPEIHVHVSVTPAQVEAAVRRIVAKGRTTYRDLAR